MSDRIFRAEWRGKKTGWEYRLDVIPPSTVALSGSPEIVKIPYRAAIVKSGSYKRSKYLIGINEGSPLKVKWNLSLLDNIPEYVELIDAIQNPATDNSVSGTTPAGHTVSDAHLMLRTIYKLWYKIPGSSEFFREYAGVQEDMDLKSWDLDRNEIEVTCIDWMKYTAELTSCIWLDNIIQDSAFTSHVNVYDVFFSSNESGGDVTYCIGYCAQMGLGASWRFWTVKYKNLFIYAQDYLTFYHRYVTRDSTVQYVVSVPEIVEYYRQSYTAAGTRGSYIAYDDLYFIGVYADHDTYVGDFVGAENGSLSPLSDISLGKKFPNSIWDLLKELYMDGFVKAYIQSYEWETVALYERIQTKYLFQYDFDTTVDLSKTRGHKIDSEGRLATCVTSLHNALGEDVDNYRATAKRGTLNQASATLPVLFNNVPVATRDYLPPNSSGYGDWSKLFLLKPGYYISSLQTSVPRYYGLYYFEKNSYMTDASTAQAFRVHENPIFRLSTTIYSQNLPNCADDFYAWTQNKVLYAFKSIKELQQNMSKAKLFALAGLDLFGGNNYCEFEFEGDFYEYTYSLFGKTVLLVGQTMHQTRFNVDLLNLSPRLSGYSDKWFAIESELDYEEETFKLKIIPQTV